MALPLTTAASVAFDPETQHQSRALMLCGKTLTLVQSPYRASLHPTAPIAEYRWWGAEAHSQLGVREEVASRTRCRVLTGKASMSGVAHQPPRPATMRNPIRAPTLCSLQFTSGEATLDGRLSVTSDFRCTR